MKSSKFKFKKAGRPAKETKKVGRPSVDISGLKPVSKVEGKINLRRKVVKEQGKVVGDTELLKKAKVVKIDSALKTSTSLEKQYNYYRNKFIKQIKDEKYEAYKKRAKDYLPLDKAEWWKIHKKDYIIPKTAKELYKTGYLKYTGEYNEDGTPKKKKIKGALALRQEVITLSKVTDKEFKKNSFLETYEFYGMQVFDSSEHALRVFKEIMKILRGLSPQKITELDNAGVISIAELYNPNDADEYAERILARLKAYLG